MEKAQRYRERAEGLRAITGDMPEGNSKRLILSISQEYDRLALLHDVEGSANDPLSTFAVLKKPEDSN